jgi:hypothetical protein
MPCIGTLPNVETNNSKRKGTAGSSFKTSIDACDRNHGEMIKSLRPRVLVTPQE